MGHGQGDYTIFHTSGTNSCFLGNLRDTKMFRFLKVDKETTKIKKVVRRVKLSTRNYWATVKPY